MSKRLYTTFMDYINELSDHTTNDPADYERYLSNRLNMDEIFSLSMTVGFIIDYPTKGFMYLSQNCRQLSGWTREEHYEGGTEMTWYLMNTNDFRIFNQNVYQDNQAFLASQSAVDHKLSRLIYNYRMKRRDGQWFHFQQTNTILKAGENNQPLAIFGTGTDFTPYNPEDRIIHRIERLDEQGKWRTVLHKNYFPDLDERDLPSKTEREVLKYILEGYSSQTIADKMNRSLHTIKTHRKNMLDKTNSHNTADLLRYAILNGLV